jgi:hypothetical protein
MKDPKKDHKLSSDSANPYKNVSDQAMFKRLYKSIGVRIDCAMRGDDAAAKDAERDEVFMTVEILNRLDNLRRDNDVMRGHLVRANYSHHDPLIQEYLATAVSSSRANACLKAEGDKLRDRYTALVAKGGTIADDDYRVLRQWMIDNKKSIFYISPAFTVCIITSNNLPGYIHGAYYWRGDEAEDEAWHENYHYDAISLHDYGRIHDTWKVYVVDPQYNVTEWLWFKLDKESLTCRHHVFFYKGPAMNYAHSAWYGSMSSSQVGAVTVDQLSRFRPDDVLWLKYDRPNPWYVKITYAYLVENKLNEHVASGDVFFTKWALSHTIRDEFHDQIHDEDMVASLYETSDVFYAVTIFDDSYAVVGTPWSPSVKFNTYSAAFTNYRDADNYGHKAWLKVMRRSWTSQATARQLKLLHDGDAMWTASGKKLIVERKLDSHGNTVDIKMRLYFSNTKNS